MALLALDLGTKRTGVAVSSSGKIVTPIGTIPSTPRSRFTYELKKIIDANKVSLIIVGDTGLTKFGGAIGEVQIRLTEVFNLPVIVVSEYETTNEAKLTTGRSDHADTEAACLILERYLEEHHE